MAAAIERAQAYVAAGADMIFAEAVTELAHIHQIPHGRRRTDTGQHYGVWPDAAVYARRIEGAGVDIVFYCCAAYRAMNAAALKVYEAIRAEGTQKNLMPLMQTREELYKYLDYHAYEKKLDELFAKRRRGR